MSQHDFNKELDGYIDKKRKEPFSTKAKAILKNEKKHDNSEEKILPELREGEVHIIKKEKGFMDNMKEMFKKKKKPEEEYVPEEEVKKVMEQKEHDEENEKEFEEESDEIEKETRHSLWYRITSVFRRDSPEEDEEKDFIDEEKFEKNMAEIESEEKKLDELEEEIDEEEKELDKKKTNLIWRFIAKMRSNKTEEDEDNMAEKEKELFYLKEDIKEIAKISTAVMKRLDEKEMKKFKESEDFGKFKDLLNKNKLIKE